MQLTSLDRVSSAMPGGRTTVLAFWLHFKHDFESGATMLPAAQGMQEEKDFETEKTVQGSQISSANESEMRYNKTAIGRCIASFV